MDSSRLRLVSVLPSSTLVSEVLLKHIVSRTSLPTRTVFALVAQGFGRLSQASSERFVVIRDSKRQLVCSLKSSGTVFALATWEFRVISDSYSLSAMV